VQSPLFGGADTAIFVGSEFPEASDDLSNDGIARPFATLNRAMIEVARRSILAGRNDEVFNARFTIVLLPGQNIICNDPGVNLGEFEQQVAGFTDDQAITQSLIRLFNSEAGGLPVPRGTSIIALDLRKTVIRPTYYPFWSRTLYEQDPGLVDSRTAILRWTGNSYFTSFTFKDKISRVSVSGITAADGDDPAILTSLRPHGFRTLVTTDASSDEIAAADRVTLSYPAGVPQLYDNVPTISAGDYYVEPLTTYTFRLRDISTGEVILRRQLPEIGVPGSSPPDFLTLTYPLTSHHRLTCIDFATELDLNVFYSKVQRAFSLQDFAGTVNNAEVAQGEVTIVAPQPAVPDISVDTVANGSPYIFNCSVRSDYGLCGALVDGSKVKGFKSALFLQLHGRLHPERSRCVRGVRRGEQELGVPQERVRDVPGHSRDRCHGRGRHRLPAIHDQGGRHSVFSTVRSSTSTTKRARVSRTISPTLAITRYSRRPAPTPRSSRRLPSAWP